jgi:hypothetical protein
MIRSLILRTSAALASAALGFAFVASPVQAASFTFSDTNCDSFTLNGSVLSCVVSNAPTGCTISGPTTGTINVPITLTAQCATGSATAWSWTGGNCAGLTTQSCSANSSAIGTITYGVTPSNAVGAGNTPTKAVVWSNTPPLAPSGCTLVANPMSFPTTAGGTVTLTASCSGGGAPTSFAWTASPSPAGFSTLTVSGSQSAAITATTFFTVTPSNSTGNGNQATVSVTVPGSVLGLCGQYGNVLPVINATWGQQSSWHSQDSGNFGDNAVWVIKLVVPPGTPNSVSTGSFTTAEFGGPNTPRQLTISPTACDFRSPKDIHGVTGPMAICQDGTSCQLSYSVSTPSGFGGIAGLTAGQTYYINVRNWSNYPVPGGYDCGQTSCGAIMNHQPASP